MKSIRNSTIIVILSFTLAACGGNQESNSEEPLQSKKSMDTATTEESMAMPEPGRPALPNDAEYDAMYFENYGTNPFIATEDDPLSTFAIDVDTGSYSLVRQYIEQGSLPPKEAVRVEEFVNYFPIDIQSTNDDTFTTLIDSISSPFGENYDLVRMTVKGKDIPIESRKPANLIFVVDVSGSMQEGNRLELVKKSLRLLTSQLQEGDTIGLVTYGSSAQIEFPPTTVTEKDEIFSAIDSLHPGGSTYAEEGLQLGYSLAREYLIDGGINRVILCSDGVANVGKTSADGILKTVAQYAEEDITLSAFGFGMGNYNDVLMEQLADKGNGNYAYIDSFSEARRIFTEALTGTLQTIANDVKIQVEFNPAFVDRYRLLGYENRDVRDEDFRNDEADGGEVGAGHTVTALYEVRVKQPTEGPIGTMHIRWNHVEDNDVEERSLPIELKQHKTDETLFLAAVAEFAEIMRDSYWAKESSLKDVLALLETVNLDDEEKLKFVGLVKNTIAIEESLYQ
ncbi:VWA domain-containing protein [Bacillus sp. HMF5848]|uniref:vWA domain-containing protein n=1 Tax=Bacillus sp. HMF5848 TaxID=2495421 RepID=UPI000F7AB866|nr:von Willebrand factor type A domain-containing protein [Bacillus sp. HMF5848]RSK25954.1 VWA domain-containing protein [Bacillus sp. HMF5848]